jgi:hypothetical protein
MRCHCHRNHENRQLKSRISYGEELKKALAPESVAQGDCLMEKIQGQKSRDNLLKLIFKNRKLQDRN